MDKNVTPSSKKRISRYVFSSMFVIVAIVVLMPKVTELKDIESIMLSMPIWIVALAILAQIISYIGSGYMLKTIMNELKYSMSVGRGILITLSSASVGMVVGGMMGSAAATYHWASRSGDGDGDVKTLMAGIVPILYNTVVLTVITITGISYLLLKHELTSIQIIGYGSALVIIVGVILIAMFGLVNYETLTNLTLKIVAKINNYRKRKIDIDGLKLNMRSIYYGIRLISRTGLIKIGVGSLTNILFDMMTLYIFFFASGHRVKPSVLIAGYSLAFLETRAAFIAPGGIGLTESSMAAVFANLGVENHIAIIVVIGYRLASFWIPNLLGFATIPYLNKTSKES